MSDVSIIYPLAIAIILVIVAAYAGYLRSRSSLPEDYLSSLDSLATFALTVVDQFVDEPEEQQRLDSALGILTGMVREWGVPIPDHLLYNAMMKAIADAHELVD